MFKKVTKQNVKLLPGVFRERMDLNRDYLMELDTTCLLQNFYLEAGIVMPGLQVVENPETAKLHWGWEAPTCQLRGHFLGHWLSAAAALIASEKDGELKAKLNKIISELARCQELNGGEWIGSFPEKYFTKLEKNQYIWSPQYVMHKTIMGLMHAYCDAGNEQALAILDHLSDWYIRWTEKMSEKNPHAVYSGEEGGMLEIWASLYEITGNKKYLTLAERYQDAGIFRKLEEEKDALTNCHANASIPFSHGAAKLYEITGEDRWRRLTELFWKSAVTDRGMYCTGSQNAGEFWVPPFLSGQFMGERNQEFCTVYNMVRTASYLYKWTGETVYADYIEKCLYNGFLAQQNSVTGMPTYFLPMSAGSRKKWGSKTRDFWCCHGTMVQAQTLYPELIYFVEGDTEGVYIESENARSTDTMSTDVMNTDVMNTDVMNTDVMNTDTMKTDVINAGFDRLIISQYIPSRLTCSRGNNEIMVEQTTGMKYYNDQAFFDEHDDSVMSRWSLKFDVTAAAAEKFTISLRVPSWVKGVPSVQLNGKDFTSEAASDISGGYLNITREWKKDSIQVFFPSAPAAEELSDMPELAAVVDGPIVLAGLIGSDCGLKGDFGNPREFLMPQVEHTYGTFPWMQNHYRTRNQKDNFLFKPLYEITDEEYTIYFTKKESN